MWDLSSLIRARTCAPALEVWSLNHWTTREVPHGLLHITYLKSAFSPSFFPFSLIFKNFFFFSMKPCHLSILCIWQKPSCHWHSPFPQLTERYLLSRPGRNVLLCSRPVRIFTVSQLQSGPFGMFSGYKSEIWLWKISITFPTLGLLSTVWFCFTFLFSVF